MGIVEWLSKWKWIEIRFYSYLGSFIRGNVLLIEMEYANGGTLAQILAQKEPHNYMPERYILTILEQITSAINYMHSENIMHRYMFVISF